MIAKYIIAVIFIVIAVFQDIKEYKIKNKLILTFLCIGVITQLISNGFRGLIGGVAGMLIPLMLFPLFALRMLGAGDIKAFCVLGMLFGTDGIIKIMIMSILSGGVIALAFMIFRRNSLSRLKYFLNYIKRCFMLKKLDKYIEQSSKETIFRFSFAIASGYIIYIIYALMGKV